MKTEETDMQYMGEDYVHYYHFLDTEHSEAEILKDIKFQGYYKKNALHVRASHAPRGPHRAYVVYLQGTDSQEFPSSAPTLASSISLCEKRVHERARGL